MKREYDFSKGERRKFFHEGANLNLPVYLPGRLAAERRKAGRPVEIRDVQIADKPRDDRGKR